LETYPRKFRSGRYSADFLIFRREKKQYFKWEQAILGLPNVVDAHEVKHMQDRVVHATAFCCLHTIDSCRPTELVQDLTREEILSALSARSLNSHMAITG